MPRLFNPVQYNKSLISSYCEFLTVVLMSIQVVLVFRYISLKLLLCLVNYVTKEFGKSQVSKYLILQHKRRKKINAWNWINSWPSKVCNWLIFIFILDLFYQPRIVWSFCNGLVFIMFPYSRVSVQMKPTPTQKHKYMMKYLFTTYLFILDVDPFLLFSKTSSILCQAFIPSPVGLYLYYFRILSPLFFVFWATYTLDWCSSPRHDETKTVTMLCEIQAF